MTNKSSKEDEYVQKGATKEIETGSIEQVGGIIEDDAWGDDVAALLDMSDSSSKEEVDDATSKGKSRSVTEPVEDDSSESSDEDVDVDDGSGEWQDGEQGWQVYDGTPSDSEDETAESPAAPVTEEIAPTEAPPLPEGGLPPGWTTDQWKWYGHEWLEKNGGQ
ncbi:MAG TPA: hypothetical protein D7H94_06385 [Candidatus Poseidoniales archaeon]|nr:MAG TPA: hypothetical protein D7H94_06385 [Candidatus Poseidoniales archaeon]